MSHEEGWKLMPFVISRGYDHKRFAEPLYSEPLMDNFFFPLARGEVLTRDLLALTPEPLVIEGPEEGRLPDMFGGGTGVWIVNENVRRVINALEPQIHTFIPVRIVRAKRALKGLAHYVLYVGQAVDAVIIDKTSFSEGNGREGFARSPVLNALRGNTVLSADKIRDRHLWRGGVGKRGASGDPFWDYLFCSDELERELTANGLEGWSYRPCLTQ